MTAEQLIEILQTLPPRTLISIFDPESGERVGLDVFDPINHWGDEPHADLNLMARTELIKA